MEIQEMGNTFEKEYKMGLGHIEYNTQLHRTLPFKREPFNDQASIADWKEMGFSQEHFTGAMFDMKHECPDWFNFEDFEEEFSGWLHLSWSFYKMTTGVVLPRHTDEFVRFKEMYEIPEGYVVGRALVMLEDWSPGHYLDLGEEAIVHWKAGDYGWWTEYGPHTAANIGTEDRYTLQLTGLIPEEFLNDSI